MLIHKYYFMKRAKIMLAAIAVIAIAGGVYAAKAKRISDIVYTKINPADSRCYSTVSTRTFEPGNEFVLATSATLVYGAVCPIVHSIYVGE
jgi:hypothetical protein